MLRIRRLIIGLTAAAVAAALVYAVYVILLRQVEMQETVQVVVPGRFVTAGTVLTDDLLERRTVTKAGLDEGMFTDTASVIGKQALIPLGAGEPVLDWKLTSLMLLPQEGEATFEIPREYIRSISGGIQQGDLVRIYLSGESGARRLLSTDVQVASVKLSSDSREQQSGRPEEAADNRRQLAALRSGQTVERINLNLTEAEWLEIDRAYQGSSGAKLVIALPSDQAILQADVTRQAFAGRDVSVSIGERAEDSSDAGERGETGGADSAGAADTADAAIEAGMDSDESDGNIETAADESETEERTEEGGSI